MATSTTGTASGREWKGVSDRDPTEVVGRRIGAALIDLIAIFVLLIVVGVVAGQGQAGKGHASVNLHGAPAVVWVILAFGYYAVPERLGGQTLGKRLLRIRVVSVGGGPPSTLSAALRTVLRVIDFLPFFYLLGLVVILTSGRRGARIGDLAARTAVVAESSRVAEGRIAR
jgi:uncharacterized RDD family membrane protein YckC